MNRDLTAYTSAIDLLRDAKHRCAVNGRYLLDAHGIVNAVDRLGWRILDRAERHVVDRLEGYLTGGRTRGE